MALERPRLLRWNAAQYARLIDHGILDEDDPVELIDGLLLVKEPQHSPHRTAIILAAKALERAFGEGWFVQTQSPITLGERSLPEPDVCVVRGSPRDFAAAHPRQPALVAEVAQSGLRFARERKAAVYARAEIAEYWIVNLVDRVLEVYRQPIRTHGGRARWGYGTVRTIAADGAITPLAASGGAIAVGDLLP